MSFNLTQEQYKAAHDLWDSKTNALQLLAGAGTGKTSTLTKAVEIAMNRDNANIKVALITFSKKAATEMAERMNKIQVQPQFIGTMHSLAFHKLSHSITKFQILKNRALVLQNIFREKLPKYSHIPAEIFLSQKEFLTTDKEIIKRAYHDYKLKKNLLDFDDLIELATDAYHKSDSPFDLIFIDEFQDTSYKQLDFIQSMKATKIFAVGDEKQSIYKFRGASPEIFLHFDSYFHDSLTRQLSLNFRSQKKIVKLANKCANLSGEVISKKLQHHFSSGSQPICYISNIEFEVNTVWSQYAPLNLNVNKSYTILVRTNFIKFQLQKIVTANYSVMTIHAAKGLEFDHVIIFAINEYILPHRWSDAEEEIRLFYVAITRAKHSLEFIATDFKGHHSSLLPFLVANCKLRYL